MQNVTRSTNCFVTPDDFGATGVGDDTAAVQAALNTGSSVSFPKRYRVTQVTSNSANRTLFSDCGGGLIGTSAVVGVLVIGGGRNSIEGMDINGGGIAPQVVVVNQSVPGTRISNCHIYNSSTTAELTECLLINGGCNNTIVTGNEIHSARGTKVARGIRVANNIFQTAMDGIVISNNSIYDVGPAADGDGIAVQGTTNNQELMHGISITGNTIYNCDKRCVKIQLAGVNVTGNNLKMEQGTAGSAAVSFQQSAGVLSGNTIFTAAGNMDACVTIGAGTRVCHDCVIAGNAFIATGAVPNLDSIQVDGDDVVGLVVTGNSFNGGRAGVRTTQACSNISITGNTFTNITANAIQQGTTGLTACTIADNTFSNITQSFFRNFSFTSSEVSMTNNVGTGLLGFPVELAMIKHWGNTGDVPTVTGSRGGNAALTDILAELDTLGFITNSTTA